MKRRHQIHHSFQQRKLLLFMDGWIISIRCYHSHKNYSIVIQVRYLFFIYDQRFCLIDYEIYAYDRAGHGYSSHLPKGFDYSPTQNLQDLRTVLQGSSLYLL